MSVELAPHQFKAIRDLSNGSILRGEVGSGKSRTALAYYYLKVAQGKLQINGHGDYAPMIHPMNLLIITTPKKRDQREWEKELSDFALTTEIGINLQEVQIVVDSWNNIHKYTHLVNQMVIFDEQRAIGNGTWAKSFISISKQNQWIVLSATPGDNWQDYIPVFIAHGFYKNRTAFVREHVVFKRSNASYPVIDHYVETYKLEKQREAITVDMPFVRHTTRHTENIVVDYDKRLFDRVWKDRWHIYEDRPLRDVGEMFIVARRLVNTDASRLAAVMELHEIHPKLIIFYNFDRELEMLRMLGNILGVQVAEWNGHRHQEIPKTDRWIYLVQYTAGSDGWNCTTTDAMVFWSLTYSYKQFEQSKGRIDRMNTPYSQLYYYIIRSGAPVDSAINNALARKEEFNERKWEREQKAA